MCSSTVSWPTVDGNAGFDQQFVGLLLICMVFSSNCWAVVSRNSSASASSKPHRPQQVLGFVQKQFRASDFAEAPSWNHYTKRSEFALSANLAPPQVDRLVQLTPRTQQPFSVASRRLSKVSCRRFDQNIKFKNSSNQSCWTHSSSLKICKLASARRQS